jgi:hypothetical protein
VIVAARKADLGLGPLHGLQLSGWDAVFSRVRRPFP